jgi:hypothetical protein
VAAYAVRHYPLPENLKLSVHSGSDKFSMYGPIRRALRDYNPSIVEEITRERLEMLGTSFIPQHSDARILEQVIYKWRNTRRTLLPTLANAYRLLFEDGHTVTCADIRRGIARLFRSNFEHFTRLPQTDSRPATIGIHS